MLLEATEAAKGLGLVIAEVTIAPPAEELEWSGALSAIATSEEPWLLAPLCPDAGQTPDQRAARVKTAKATSGFLRMSSPVILLKRVMKSVDKRFRLSLRQLFRCTWSTYRLLCQGCNGTTVGQSIFMPHLPYEIGCLHL